MPYLLAQDARGGGHGDGHGGHLTEVNPLDFAAKENLQAALWALGIFLVVLFVLRKFAWGPIVRGMDAREQRINESLAKAEAVEKATRELQEAHRQAMAKAQQEAQQVVAEARLAAKKAAEGVAARATAEIEASRDRFQKEMALEAEKVKAELRAQAVDLTMTAASRVLGRALTAADHQKLVEDALRDAEATARG